MALFPLCIGNIGNISDNSGNIIGNIGNSGNINDNIYWQQVTIKVL